MNIKEIYEAFDKIGVLSFSTVNSKNEPVARVAHLRGYDEDGIYFMTMSTKSFFKELIENGNVAVSGLHGSTGVTHDEEGMPLFEASYSIRMTGKVKHVPIEDIINKNNPIFEMGIKDKEKYKVMEYICITEAYGEIFDFDFEKVSRDHKLKRIYFSYNGAKIDEAGLIINQEKCIKCGICMNKCTFDAISIIDGNYVIDKTRCDECGDCYINCPVKAIHTKHENY